MVQEIEDDLTASHNWDGYKKCKITGDSTKAEVLSPPRSVIPRTKNPLNMITSLNRQLPPHYHQWKTCYGIVETIDGQIILLLLQRVSVSFGYSSEPVRWEKYRGSCKKVQNIIKINYGWVHGIVGEHLSKASVNTLWFPHFISAMQFSIFVDLFQSTEFGKYVKVNKADDTDDYVDEDGLEENVSVVDISIHYTKMGFL